MAEVIGHLEVAELGARYRAASDPVERTHCHIVWLLASGHEVAGVAKLMHFSKRWVQKILARYNAEGPSALGDQRRGNKGAKPLLNAGAEPALRARLAQPPDDGGLWTGAKVAAWMAQHLEVDKGHPQRGWEALRRLGHTLQVPRPGHAQAATPEAQETFKKGLPRWSPKKPPGTRASASRPGRSTSTASD